jgi:glycosyltransferase involved in cell wall biosynthesis
VISILIPTSGSAEWISTARTVAGNSAYGQGAHETLLVHDPDGTIATARNLAAQQATGDWLCFLDADDQLDPMFIAFMQKSISRHPEHWKRLYTPAVSQVRGGRRTAPSFFPECSLETGNWLIIGTVISKRLFTGIGGFREHPHGLEDWNLWRRAVRFGAEIVKVKRAIYIAHYNHHSAHHKIRRDRKAYVAAYEAARADV